MKNLLLIIFILFGCNIQKNRTDTDHKSSNNKKSLENILKQNDQNLNSLDSSKKQNNNNESLKNILKQNNKNLNSLNNNKKSIDILKSKNKNNENVIKESISDSKLDEKYKEKLYKFWFETKQDQPRPLGILTRYVKKKFKDNKSISTIIFDLIKKYPRKEQRIINSIRFFLYSNSSNSFSNDLHLLNLLYDLDIQIYEDCPLIQDLKIPNAKFEANRKTFKFTSPYLIEQKLLSLDSTEVIKGLNKFILKHPIFDPWAKKILKKINNNKILINNILKKIIEDLNKENITINIDLNKLKDSDLELIANNIKKAYPENDIIDNLRKYLRILYKLKLNFTIPNKYNKIKETIEKQIKLIRNNISPLNKIPAKIMKNFTWYDMSCYIHAPLQMLIHILRSHTSLEEMYEIKQKYKNEVNNDGNKSINKIISEFIDLYLTVVDPENKNLKLPTEATSKLRNALGEYNSEYLSGQSDAKTIFYLFSKNFSILKNLFTINIKQKNKCFKCNQYITISKNNSEIMIYDKSSKNAFNKNKSIYYYYVNRDIKNAIQKNKRSILAKSNYFYLCKKCNSESELFEITKTYSSPEVLLLINPGRNISKWQHLDYQLELDFNEEKYNLASILVHTGTDERGHFKAYVKNPDEKNNEHEGWYLANDLSDKLQRVYPEIVQNIKNETPMIYIYEKEK
ncbi:MAG: ubiquitin carboxyl-terminal hydrolase [Bacteroidetes bacterium]|nr:ubiquitin carboxyl-terminal hydrolase [Bacteroidota bacterium]